MIHFTKPSKSAWPECTGLDANVAKQLIKNDYNGVQVHIVPQNSVMTMDYRTNRVRIFVDNKNIVIRDPTVG